MGGSLWVVLDYSGWEFMGGSGRTIVGGSLWVVQDYSGWEFMGGSGL